MQSCKPPTVICCTWSKLTTLNLKIREWEEGTEGEKDGRETKERCDEGTMVAGTPQWWRRKQSADLRQCVRYAVHVCLLCGREKMRDFSGSFLTYLQRTQTRDARYKRGNGKARKWAEEMRDARKEGREEWRSFCSRKWWSDTVTEKEEREENKTEWGKCAVDSEKIHAVESKGCYYLLLIFTRL